MAVHDLYTVNTGTATTGDVLTYATGTTNTDGTWTTTEPISIYQPQQQIKVTRDPYAGTLTESIDDIFKKREFWDGIEWEEFKTWMPRKSITGKIIIGKMHKRSKNGVIKGGSYQQANVKHTVLDRRTSHTQYAKTKELFEEKLKGKA